MGCSCCRKRQESPGSQLSQSGTTDNLALPLPISHLTNHSTQLHPPHKPTPIFVLSSGHTKPLPRLLSGLAPSEDLTASHSSVETRLVFPIHQSSSEQEYYKEFGANESMTDSSSGSSPPCEDLKTAPKLHVEQERTNSPSEGSVPSRPVPLRIPGQTLTSGMGIEYREAFAFSGPISLERYARCSHSKRKRSVNAAE
jgi:hypothetical protein